MAQDHDSIVSKDESVFRWPGQAADRGPAQRRSARVDDDETPAPPAVEAGEPPGPHPALVIARALWRGAARLPGLFAGLTSPLRRLAPLPRLAGLAIIVAGLVHLWPPLAASAFKVEMLDRLAGLMALLPGGRAITLDFGPALAGGPAWWWICAFSAPVLHFASARSAAAGKWRDAAFVLACGLVAAIWAWFTFAGQVLRPPVLAASAREALITLVAVEIVAVLAIWLFTRAPPQPAGGSSD